MLCIAVVTSMLQATAFSSPAAAAGPTTSVTITKYDAHGNVIGNTTVDYTWMQANLPVYGDGTTHYYAQGPTFDNTNFSTVWNPTEDTNVDSRDYGAAIGTDVKDLCNLVGGATAGCTIKIKASDGFSKVFDYENVYNPKPQQGKMVIAWYNPTFGGYVPTYDTGMRLIFFADTSTNPNGWHAFGDWDMHEAMPDSRWYYYGASWPSSSGLSVQYVSNISIYEPNLISCDASGNAKESFAPGETVYVKGLGLAANTSYKLWIQPEPVSNNKLYIENGSDPVLLSTYTFNASDDPSGAQEAITTNATGDFSPTAIWAIATSASSLQYDIVADSQASGTIGKYDITDVSGSTKRDYIDNPGWQGFTVATPAPAWDLNGDHICTIGDVVKIGLKWGQTGSAGWIPEDVSPDGVINIGDVVVIGLHWGQSW